ncbi:hypothetical protein H1C71_020747 [Ictidomys tridecemlineatus]|nr:hypothetical protein H1C71_020747 [Ictidomys tridecemlineatus]
MSKLIKPDTKNRCNLLYVKCKTFTVNSFKNSMLFTHLLKNFPETRQTRKAYLWASDKGFGNAGLGFEKQGNFTLFILFAGLSLGSADGGPLTQGGGCFLDSIQTSQSSPSPIQAPLLSFSHCDKASSIINSLHQECLGHSPLI